MVPTMTASVEAMLEGWRDYVGKETEVYENFSVLTSEVISKTAFGSSYLEGKNIFEMLEKLGMVWWTPIYIQYVMRSQGVKGPSYEFFHGNNKEVINMKKISMIRPMDLSHDIFSRIQPHMYSWIKQYGKHFLLWNGPQTQLVVTEPEPIKEILSNKNGAFPKIKLQSHAKKLIGDGLVASEGKKWSKLHTLSNHTFHAESLKEMVPTMTASVEAMLEGWRDYVGKETEVYENFSVLTSEVISKTAFGSSYLEGKNIFEMLEKLGMVIFRNDGKVRFPIPK
ncbi:unnamed protein product [Ilex paraguariensis]|uniref:Cytochrome P450 n=1 Tax=Ilex paraguariensis TaxID=185542 RepID=A0ABC8SD36_9AQUA